MKTPEEKALEIVTEFRGKFVNWENAQPMIDSITKALQEQREYIEALEAECEASVIAIHWAESATITPSQAAASINSKKDYNKARSARLKLKGGKS